MRKGKGRLLLKAGLCKLVLSGSAERFDMLTALSEVEGLTVEALPKAPAAYPAKTER